MKLKDMKLKDAFNYILDKNNALSDFKAYMVDVAYEEDDTFLLVNLTIHNEKIIPCTIMLMLQVEKLRVHQAKRIFTVLKALKTCLSNCLYLLLI